MDGQLLIKNQGELEKVNFEHLIWLLNNTDMEIGNEQDKILEFVLKLKAEQQAHNSLREKLKEKSMRDISFNKSCFICGGQVCEGSKRNTLKHSHAKDCWLNAELQAIKEESK